MYGLAEKKKIKLCAFSNEVFPFVCPTFFIFFCNLFRQKMQQDNGTGPWGKETKEMFDPDVIRTRNLLIWSQTRYRCATKSPTSRCICLPRFHESSNSTSSETRRARDDLKAWKTTQDWLHVLSQPWKFGREQNCWTDLEGFQTQTESTPKRTSEEKRENCWSWWRDRYPDWVVMLLWQLNVRSCDPPNLNAYGLGSAFRTRILALGARHRSHNTDTERKIFLLFTFFSPFLFIQSFLSCHKIVVCKVKSLSGSSRDRRRNFWPAGGRQGIFVSASDLGHLEKVPRSFDGEKKFSLSNTAKKGERNPPPPIHKKVRVLKKKKKQEGKDVEIYLRTRHRYPSDDRWWRQTLTKKKKKIKSRNFSCVCFVHRLRELGALLGC